MNADWFYSDGDNRLGPVTEDELRRLAQGGQLRPADLVWRDGMPDWVEARTVEVLFPPYAQAAQAVPTSDDRPSRRRFDDDRRRDDDYAADDRPRVRRDDRDADDRPRIRRSANDLDDDYDDRPRRRNEKPGQIQAVAIMMLVGGILGVLVFLGFAASCIGLVWPGIYFELVVAIMAIVRGSNMLGRDDQGPPRTIAILLIICIVNLDFVNCVLGIVCLVMLNDPQVQAYYRRKGFA